MKFNEITSAAQTIVMAIKIGQMINEERDGDWFELANTDKYAAKLCKSIGLTEKELSEMTLNTSKKIDDQISKLMGVPVSMLHTIRYVPLKRRELGKLYDKAVKIDREAFIAALVENGIIDAATAKSKALEFTLCISYLYRWQICHGKKLNLKTLQVTKSAK